LRIGLEDWEPCAKQQTLAIVEKNGKFWIGSNSCRRPQKTCPRGDMASGVGYELCKDICDQTDHAEVNAIKAAGRNAEGAILYLFGHTRICDECRKFSILRGIKKIVINENRG